MEASPQQISVEELPLEKKLEVLRKHNQYENYDLERFIDAQDSVNTWCLGQISEVDQRTVRIHFDGWSTKWDIVSYFQEIFSFDSKRSLFFYQFLM